MISTLLDFSQHPALKNPSILEAYINCLFYAQHNQRKLKHSFQQLLTLLIQSDYLEFSASLIASFTKQHIEDSLPRRSSSHLTAVTKKREQLTPTLTNSFIYQPATVFQLHPEVVYKSNADLAAIIFYTLSKHSPISSKDIERLSQKYILHFPSLIDSTYWDLRYNNSRSRFTIFCGNVLRTSTQLGLIARSYSGHPSTYSLTEKGETLVATIYSAIQLPVAS